MPLDVRLTRRDKPYPGISEVKLIYHSHEQGAIVPQGCQRFRNRRSWIAWAGYLRLTCVGLYAAWRFDVGVGAGESVRGGHLGVLGAGTPRQGLIDPFGVDGLC